MDKKEFGQYLKQIRESRGLTIRQVETYANVSNSYLSLIENGKRDIPHPDILKKLAPLYKVPYEDLMTKAGYINNENINMPEIIIKNDIDELEEEFPEGVKVLRRASKKLSPEARKTMIRLMKAFLEEEENKD